MGEIKYEEKKSDRPREGERGKNHNFPAVVARESTLGYTLCVRVHVAPLRPERVHESGLNDAT